MSQITKIKSIKKITHDVLRIRFEKPNGYQYIPGQAADIAINQTEWKDQLSCFTFTSLPEDKHLEFTIKTYPERNRVTNQLLSAKVGDELILKDPFGDIRSNGPGVFIAGGAGITPFIAIIKVLEKENELNSSKLLFANKMKKDIIDRDYFEKVLGNNFINILSDEKVEGYEYGFVTAELIKKYAEDRPKKFYLCGPPPMMKAVEKHLASLGIQPSDIIKERF